jgi:hypothetical protein
VFVHPLSAATIDELTRQAPVWFDSAELKMCPDLGTFDLRFTHAGSPGSIATTYCSDDRHHYLSIAFAQLIGRVSLSDMNKTAWQHNIGDDLEKIPTTVSEMITKIEAAAHENYDGVDNVGVLGLSGSAYSNEDDDGGEDDDDGKTRPGA